MADFIARIKAQVDTSDFTSEINSLARRSPLKLKIKLNPSDIDTSGIGSKVQSALDKHKFTISISKIKITGNTANLGKHMNKVLTDQVKYKIDTRQIDASISGIQKKFDKLNSGKFVFRTDDAERKLDEIAGSLSEIEEIRNRMDMEDGKELIASYKELHKHIETAKNSLRELSDVSETLASDTDISTFGGKLEMWANENSKAMKKFGGTFELLRTKFQTLASSGEMTVDDLRGLEKELKNIDIAARSAGVSGKSFGQIFKESLSRVTGYFTAYEIIMRITQATKEAVQTVVELDTALVDLQKTTTASASQLNQYYYEANDIAKEYGSTTQEIIQSTADWSRLGFNLQDSKTMAKVASQFKSISPGMDIETATSGLVSIMKAFDINAGDALDGIASKINKIGNTAATSNTEIVTGLEKSSAAMAAMGTSFDETVALFTAGQEIIQDSSRMGNALRTVGMRLRGYNEETGELDDELQNISGELYNLTTVAGKGGVSIFTDETQEHYKSVYQYLSDISDRWDEMSEKQKQGFLNKAFAKTRASEGAAIVQNFEAARKAMDDMANSANSANEEMEVIRQSLTYKLNALKETGVGVAQNLFNRKEVGVAIDGAKLLLNAIDWLTDKIGLLGSVATTVIVGDLIKNMSKLSGVATAVKTLGGVANTFNLASSIASTRGLGTAFSELATAIGVSTKALGLFTGASVILGAVLGALALDKIITTAGEANDKMDETASKFKNASENLESLQSQLNENNNAIKELNDGTPLTFVEQGELKKLQETNDQLKESIKLANEQREEERKKLAKDSASAYNKNFKSLLNDEDINKKVESADLTFDSIKNGSASDVIALMRRIQKIREDASDTSLYTSEYEDAKGVLRENIELLNEYKTNLETARKYGDLTASEAQALNDVNRQMDFIYKELGDVNWQAQKLDEFLGVGKMNELKNELVEISKSGELTLDVFNDDKYKGIRAFLDSIGMDYQIFIDNINAGTLDADSMQRQIKDAFSTDATADEWNEFLSGLSDEEVEVIYGLYSSGSADGFSIEDFKEYLKSVEEHEVVVKASVDIADVSKDLTNLSTALGNSLSASGLTAIGTDDTPSDISNIRAMFNGLEGYDESKLFESTANGIHLNRDELRKLNAEYEKQKGLSLNNELLSATLAYDRENRALMKINDTESDAYKAQLATVEASKKSVDEINLKIAAYRGLTSVYKKYQDSLSMTDERAGYEAITSGYDSVKKLIDQGWAGDEEVRQYIDLMTNGSQQDWTASELKKRFAELSKNKVAGKFKVTDFFTVDDDGNSTTKGVKNFFDALIIKQKELGKNWIELTGKQYEFKFNNKEVADALGVDIELVEQLIRAGSETGLSINMNDSEEVIANLNEQIRESDKKMQEYFAHYHKDDFKNYNDSAIEYLRKQRDHYIGDESKSGKEAYKYQDLQLRKLIELRLEAEQPAYMKLDVSSFTGSASIALSALQNYGKALENLNRQKLLSPEADTSELRKSVHEAAKQIKQLSDEEKLSIGIDPSWDLKTIKEKLAKGEITIPIDADTEQIKETVKTMMDELQNYEIKFHITEDGSWQMYVNELKSEEPSIVVDVQNGEDAYELIDAINNKLPPDQHVEIVADAVGGDDVVELTDEIYGVPNRKTEVKANTVGKKQIVDLQHTIKEVGGKNVTVNALVNGTDRLSNLQRLIRDIKSKTVTVSTKTINTIETNRKYKYYNSREAQAFGSARANGTAYAKGKWGIPRRTNALVGELGQEIVVDPRSGIWRTVGDDGAEFVDIPKDAIIFNHMQSEQLLKYRKINSRGRAFVAGNNTEGIGEIISPSGKSKTKTSSSTNSKTSKAASDVSKASKTVSKNSNSSAKSTEKATSNLEKFQSWLEKFIDWIEIKITRTTDKIDKFVARAELATSRGNYNTASKNYRKAMNSSFSLMDIEKSASVKYEKFANNVLKKAVSSGALTSKQVDVIKKKVASGSLNIEDYSEQVRGVISAYQEWADKARTAKDSITDLQSKVDGYVSSLKELRDTQRDVQLESIENLTNAGVNGNTTEFNTQVSNSQLGFKNSQLLKQGKVYSSTTKSVASDVNAIGKQASKYVKSEKKGASKAYKAVLDRIRKRIAKKQTISSKDLGAVKKRNETLYNRLVVYNIALDNLEVARMEESLNYAESSAEIYKNISDMYSNKDKVSEDKISLYNSMADNSTSASSKNNYLDKVLEQYAKIQSENEAEIQRYNDSLNSSKSIISKGRSKLVGGSYSGLSESSKKKVMSVIEDAKSAVKKGVAIPTSVLSKASDYYSKGYLTYAFYKACVDYNNAIQMKAEAEAQAEIDKQTYIEQKASIGKQKFENVENEYANRINSTEQGYDLLESKAKLATAQGKDVTQSNYEKRIEYLKQQQTIYSDEIDALTQTINENIDSGLWTTSSQEYIDAMSALNEYKVSLDEAKISEEELKDELRDDVLWRAFDRAHDSVERFGNILEGISSLLDDDMFFDTNGKITEYGIANLGELVKQYQNAQEEIENFSNDIQNLNELYAEGWYTQDEYDEKLNELQTSMLSSASDMKGYIDNIKAMYKEIDQNELDALGELIDARKKALDSKKSYYEYDKNLKSKTKDLQELNAQLSALEGINTAEAKRKKAEIKESIQQAEQELEDTVQSHNFDMLSDGLDDLKDTLQNQFDEKWDNLSTDLDSITALLENANQLTAESATKTNETINKLLEFYGISTGDTGISADKSYATGVKKVPYNMNALTNENGNEIIVTRDGLITPLRRGDGVVPSYLTERLYEMARGHNIKDRKFTTPYIGKAETTVNQHFDSLIHIDGSADAATVEDLKRMEKGLLKTSYKYTSEKMWEGYMKSGGRRTV